MSSVLDTLITDRTSEDLTRETDKAYIAYTDLNRVESACQYLAELFGIAIKTKVWKMEDFRTASNMVRLKENISALRAAYYVKASTPSLPRAITYTGIKEANDIEQILKDLGEMYANMESGMHRLSFRFSGRSLGNRR